MSGEKSKTDWVDAVVKYVKGTTLDVEVVGTKEEVSTTTAKAKTMHPTSVEGVNDMILLADLFEGSLLRNLRLRYDKDDIYVRPLLSDPFLFGPCANAKM